MGSAIAVTEAGVVNSIEFASGRSAVQIVADVGVGALSSTVWPQKVTMTSARRPGASRFTGTQAESGIPGMRRQQGVHRHVWIGVDASHMDHASRVPPTARCCWFPEPPPKSAARARSQSDRRKGW